MTLSQQLKDILSEKGILPDDPEDAITGTDLLILVRPKLLGQYSDNSLRQTFSNLAADATAPIARAEKGYGYYRRPVAQQAIAVPETIEDISQTGHVEEVGREVQLEEKFRAFYLRYIRLENGFPVHIEHLAAQRRQAGVNKWKFPDAVVLTWDVGDAIESGFVLDKSTLEVRRGLGEQPFKLSSTELKVELSLGSFREFFFQCVSNSKWAHLAKLTIACPVSDFLLANELRRLGSSYGVAVSYFPFSSQELESMPKASEILRMSDEEFEKIARSKREINLTPGIENPSLDWEHIKDLRSLSNEFVEIFDWIARCLKDSRAYTMENYRELTRIENAAG